MLSDRENEISGDITGRIALREKLKCKDFQWYVDNIYPEVDVRKDYNYIGQVSQWRITLLISITFPQFYIKQIQNVDSQTCLVAYQENSNAFLQSCYKTFSSQVFFLTNLNEIRIHDLCLDAAENDGVVKALKCHPKIKNQKWEYDDKVETYRKFIFCLLLHQLFTFLVEHDFSS